jgi:hypothetical protein
LTRPQITTTAQGLQPSTVRTVIAATIDGRFVIEGRAHGQKGTVRGRPRPGIVRTGSNGGSVIPLRKKSLKLKRESTRLRQFGTMVLRPSALTRFTNPKATFPKSSYAARAACPRYVGGTSASTFMSRTRSKGRSSRRGGGSQKRCLPQNLSGLDRPRSDPGSRRRFPQGLRCASWVLGAHLMDWE